MLDQSNKFWNRKQSVQFRTFKSSRGSEKHLQVRSVSNNQLPLLSKWFSYHQKSVSTLYLNHQFIGNTIKERKKLNTIIQFLIFSFPLTNQSTRKLKGFVKLYFCCFPSHFSPFPQQIPQKSNIQTQLAKRQLFLYSSNTEPFSNC